MKNNMSDWDAKKAFTTKYLYKNNYIPQIYIDDYWNYYRFFKQKPAYYFASI